MTLFNRFLIFPIWLIFLTHLQAQNTRNNAIENALLIVEQNKSILENCKQLLVVYNEQPESYGAVLVVLEKKADNWVAKFDPVDIGIGKNGFALPLDKLEGDGKSPTGLFRLGKLFTYEKNVTTLLETQQTTKEDKWIDDPNSPDYNRHIRGTTEAKSYENLLLESDAYKYCMVIEYNTNPIIKGKGSAIFFHLTTKAPYFTAGCVAVNEDYMKQIVNWLDPKQNPSIIIGNLTVLKSGL